MSEREGWVTEYVLAGSVPKSVRIIAVRALDDEGVRTVVPLAGEGANDVIRTNQALKVRDVCVCDILVVENGNGLDVHKSKAQNVKFEFVRKVIVTEPVLLWRLLSLFFHVGGDSGGVESAGGAYLQPVCGLQQEFGHVILR